MLKNKFILKKKQNKTTNSYLIQRVVFATLYINARQHKCKEMDNTNVMRLVLLHITGFGKTCVDFVFV